MLLCHYKFTHSRCQAVSSKNIVSQFFPHYFPFLKESISQISADNHMYFLKEKEKGRRKRSAHANEMGRLKLRV